MLNYKNIDPFRQLLSNQQHYDWGLRALKTVIGFCGTILKASAPLKSISEECSVAVQALELNTISKLTFDDSVLFKSLISDIFPEIKITNSPEMYDTLTKKIRKTAEDLGLQISQRQVIHIVWCTIRCLYEYIMYIYFRNRNVLNFMNNYNNAWE